MDETALRQPVLQYTEYRRPRVPEADQALAAPSKGKSR
jgi:hypothetical protein